MVSSINSTLASTLFGTGASSADAGVSADMLVAIARARAGIGVDTQAATQDPNAPLAPVWQPGISPSAAALVQRAVANKQFFDVNAKLYSDLGATGDYRRLFALYSGLTTLQALAGRAEDASLSNSERAQTETQFARGMSELEAFLAQQHFEDIRLAQGDRVDAAQSTLAMQMKSEDYVTGLIHKGGLYAPLAGLAKDAKFNIVATSAAGTARTVAIDLSQMGSISRSLGAVIGFINSKLAAAGVSSRLEAVDQTPKTTNITLGGRTVAARYTGLKQYALKVDVRGGERVAFEAAEAAPAFYLVGGAPSGARLIKLQDVDGAAGQPALLARPQATADASGAYLATGWLGPGAPYATPSGSVAEQRTGPLTSSGPNTFETAMRAPGEAVLTLDIGDGRSLSVTTAWRSEDLEAWRARSGESSDRAMLDDLAERLTQLLHEQGVAAGVDVWEDGDENLGFSILGGDRVKATSLSIGGKSAALASVDPSGMIGGLRDGVFARRFEAPAVAGANDLFVGDQRFTFTTAAGAQSITIVGGEAGIDATALVSQLNQQLRNRGVAAAAYLDDIAGALTLRFDALHDVLDVSAAVNEEDHALDLAAPGAWVNGGLPLASPGQLHGDAVRSYSVANPPLATHSGGLDIAVVVATPAGEKTINVSVSATERANDADPSPGQWSAAFQSRLETALNQAGVYLSAAGGDLSSWSIAESSGQRLVSVSINGDALELEGDAPGFGVGGAFSAERSFTSAAAASGVGDDVASLLGDQNVSITFATIWGETTVSAALQPGDAPTLESAALRLNQALAKEGYDLGAAAVALSGGGAGLRLVSGGSHSLRTVSQISLGGTDLGVTLDPIDAVAYLDDAPGAGRVAVRAGRGAAVSETIAAASPFTAPSINSTAWFPGRAFDVAVGAGAKVATARAVAAGADGSVYVLADLSGDAAASAIKGDRDVALMKYDSAGKLLFMQMLGATQSASGFALAVSGDGKVAVAGSVEGALSGASAKGGADSFVSLFDASGKELWTARRGAAANDEARAIAFAADGAVIVAGKTESALSGQSAFGAGDGYVRGYSAAGGELFARQFGTGQDDAATALLVADNGSGGFDIFTGGVENNRGVVRRFFYSAAAGFSAGATRDIGYFHEGAIGALASDGGALYVAGAIGADRLSVANTARGAVAGKEGFVARLDADLVSSALDRATYLGSAGDDAVCALAIVAGNVYAAGVAGGVLAGSGGFGAKQGFLARLDNDGQAAWTRSFNSPGGGLTLNGLAVDASGASALDVLGLPRGTIAGGDSSALIDRSALRVGDEFSIGADGRRLSTIRIGERDTLGSLAAAITRAIGSAGRAELVREDGVERIKISPRDGKAVRIEPGREGRDALAALGFAQGVISVNGAGRRALKTYGLGLIAAELKLDGEAAIKKTKAELSAAVSIVRQAYDALLNPHAKALTPAEQALEARRQAAGAASGGYYAAKLANYQAALARLTGGG